MNITIIAYRPNGDDYCRGNCVGRSDSDFVMHFIEHEGTNTSDLVEQMADVIKTHLFEEHLYGDDYAYENYEITFLIDGIEINDSSPNLILRTNAINLAEKKSNLMFTEHKNELIRAKQAIQDADEKLAKENRKAEYKKLQNEFGNK